MERTDSPFKIQYKSPYEMHGELNHGKMVAHSPNGIDTIEECTVCGARFLYAPINKTVRALNHDHRIIAM